MLKSLFSVVTAMALLVAATLFLVAFVLAPLIVLAGGYVVFAFATRD